MTDNAPELDTGRWFNASGPLTLAALRGKVVVLHAFQMLCPGCVAHGTPQAETLHRMFARSGEVVVIGLHTVFEHHAAMTEAALEAFIHEYRLTLPVGVDRPGEDGPIPRTMRRYGMRGTPSTIVIDRDGVVREHAFGQVDDLALGVLVGSLVAASAVSTARAEVSGRCDDTGGCDDTGCPLPATSAP
ncbi:alkyl hydroperoxide reductase [Methylobacterium variabile]|uniref:Alkyl hydroperoxide reductase n=1 Tax=Methylobacterium variabile TaxID=298794 RepID=A0A0J6SIA4_9HYPH|nr:redoxin domain-containing protein [Methylobacterium variabile]KMO33447.1 alkyl hydroperoxide reductase [Methylobacterium variabile]